MSWIDSKGYIALMVGYRRVREHVLVAECALGKSLPAGTEVHHVNGIRIDNANTNLVVCENRSYHCLLHIRAAAKKAIGDVRGRQCDLCKQWEVPGEDMQVYIVKKFPDGVGQARHRSCANRKQQQYAEAVKGARE